MGVFYFFKGKGRLHSVVFMLGTAFKSVKKLVWPVFKAEYSRLLRCLPAQF